MSRGAVCTWSRATCASRRTRSSCTAPRRGCAALIGYVEATREEDRTRSAICRPTPFPSTPADWVAMTLQGLRSVRAFTAQPDVAAWASSLALNPARVPPGAASAALQRAQERIAQDNGPAEQALARLVDAG